MSYVRRVLLFVTLVWCAAATPAVAQVDFSGAWAPIMHEDSTERAAGADIGDFLVRRWHQPPLRSAVEAADRAYRQPNRLRHPHRST